jgi:phosphate starvation-inducible PhoH-like protein
MPKGTPRKERTNATRPARGSSNYAAKHDQYSGGKFHITAKNVKQQFLLDSIEGSAITVALGPAGTGKTYVSVKKAVQLFMQTGSGYRKIILARSIIPTGKSMGYLPGDVTEKLVPWVLPMLSVIEDSLGKSQMEYLMATDAIEIQPLETIRGRSFENALILIDEAQNLDFEEIKAITTRLGEGSKMILMGDAWQSDIRGDTPLLDFCAMCERANISIPVVQFSINEIVRSDIVGALVKMFHLEGRMGHRD